MNERPESFKNKKIKVDVWIIISILFLVLVGIVAIFDSSVVTAFRDFGDKYYYFKNQMAWATLGIFTMTFFSFFNYHKLLKLAPIFFVLTTFLLILVPIIGTEVLGAKRWITMGRLTFQPSEFAKLSAILYATYIMTKLHNFKIKLTDTLIVYFLPIVFATVLIIIQPDLGTALILMAVAVTLYFVSNTPIWHLAMALPVIIIGSVLAILSQPYRIERLKAFLDPNYDPSGASYHINQIIIALKSGGLLGVGLGSSRSKFEFIPEVHNDAIFAVIVEEVGFIGGLLLIGVFMFLIFRSISVAKNTDDFSRKILALGIASLISIQVLFNLASVVALVPLTGVPLPFISYGGSSLFVNLSAIGILININRNS